MRFVHCDYCDNEIEEGDELEVNSTNYCDRDCAENAGHEACCVCEDWCDEDAIRFKGSVYCNEDCVISDGYEKCQSCKEYVADNSRNRIVDNENSVYCDADCAHDYKVYPCEQCNEYFDIEAFGRITTVENLHYCSKICAERSDCSQCNYCKEYTLGENEVHTAHDYYCSEHCATSDGNTKCPNCDKWFMVDNGDSIEVHGTVYCSQECVGELECTTCGHGFELPKGFITVEGDYFCSLDCAERKNVTNCTTCNVFYYENLGVHVGAYQYCSKRCMEIGTVTCDYCNDLISKKTFKEIPNTSKKACVRCIQKMKASSSPKDATVKMNSKPKTTMTKQQQLFLAPYSIDNYEEKLKLNDVAYFSKAMNSKDKSEVFRVKSILERYKSLINQPYQLNDKSVPGYAVLEMNRRNDLLFFTIPPINSSSVYVASKTSIIEITKEKEIKELFNLVKDGNLNRLENLANKSIYFELFFSVLNRTKSISKVVNKAISLQNKK